MKAEILQAWQDWTGGKPTEAGMAFAAGYLYGAKEKIMSDPNENAPTAAPNFDEAAAARWEENKRGIAEGGRLPGDDMNPTRQMRPGEVRDYYGTKRYKPVDAMDFSGALAAMKAGARVCRSGWNGKGMWLVYAGRGAFFDRDGELVMGDLTPHIVMKTADDKFVPWLASQTDILADDWMIVP